jgi:molybdopterin-guanine dinucleotide biosynthesis protein A
MGRSKAWLPIDDRTMASVVVEAVRIGLAEARIATDSHPGHLTSGESDQSERDRYQPPVVIVGAQGQDLPPVGQVIVARDEIAGRGPLQGMAAGLKALEGHAEAAFVCSCDLPLLRPLFVARLFHLLGDADSVVPRVDGRLHPLAAVYRLPVLAVISAMLADGEQRTTSLVERVNSRIVGEEDLRAADPRLVSLHNVNTPEEYRRLVAG